jgi:hypothetical protein
MVKPPSKSPPGLLPKTLYLLPPLLPPRRPLDPTVYPLTVVIKKYKVDKHKWFKVQKEAYRLLASKELYSDGRQK